MPVVGVLYYRSALKSFVPEIANKNRQRAEEQAKKILRDTSLGNLIGLNREQLALYHAITTHQARSAARNSQAAMSVGFLILLVGAAVAIQTNDQASKLVIGALASIGSIFSGYIGRTFLIAQQRAMEQLYRYWQQPLATSYLLSAERLAKELTDDTSKDEMLASVIGQALAAALFRKDDHDTGLDQLKLSHKRTNKGGQPTGTRPATSNKQQQPALGELTGMGLQDGRQGSSESTVT
jgi:Cyanobacterial TRADD-N associated 2-Transmembrane domain